MQARSFYAWVCMTSLILLETFFPPTPYPHRSMPPALEKIKNQPIHFTWAYRTSEKLILCCLLIKTQMFYKMLIQFSNRKPCLNSSMEPELHDKERKCIQIQKKIFEQVFNFQFTLPQDFRVMYWIATLQCLISSVFPYLLRGCALALSLFISHAHILLIAQGWLQILTFHELARFSHSKIFLVIGFPAQEVKTITAVFHYWFKTHR